MSENNNNKTKVDVPVLTERDIEILLSAVRSLEGGFPKPDLAKFAALAGFKNTNSASVSLNLLKKKITGDAPAVKTPRKPLPSGKRKQSTPREAGDDDVEESPTKKAKTTPKKVSKKDAAAKAESDQDGNDAFI